MNFVSPFALWFLPLAVLPVLIHLLSRRKYKHVYFSHLGFIHESLKHARRISRLARLLTLLARTVLLIVLIFLFARPVIHYGGTHTESGATAMVILCDVSYSMAARYNSFTALNLAKEAGKAILNSKDLSNVTAIIAFSDKIEKTLPFTFRKDSAIGFLDGLHTVPRPTNVYPALGAAGKLLSEATASNKVIVILTDLAKHGWSGDNSALDGLNGALIVLVDVVPKDAGRVNLAVLSTVCLMQGSSASVTATINNFGPRASPGVLLTIKNGDVVLAQDKFEVKTGEEVECTLSFPVSAVKGERGRGSNIYVEITGSDDILDIDNRYYLRPEEFKPLRLLVVDGDPGASPAQSETFYINSALSSAIRQIDYRIVTSPGMIQEKLPEWDVITLANLGEMEEQSVSELVRYVAAGGKLLISGGDKVECCSLSWSSRFSGPSGLFGHSMKVDAGIEVVNGVPGEKMDRGFEWEQLKVKRMLAVNSPRDSVAWLRAGGNPLLVSWKYGRGELMIFTSTIDREWTNMPAKPVFAPFWLEKFRYLGEDDDAAKPGDCFNPVEYSPTESDLTIADKGYIASRLPGTSIHKINFEGDRKTFISRLKMLLSGKEIRLGLVAAILLLLGIETYLSRRKGIKL